MRQSITVHIKYVQHFIYCYQIETMTESAALLQGLNASQIAAVTHMEGPVLVLAGPGSGKTRVITHRIAHMIASGVSPKNIVALTFTNKAAGEMKTRLRTLVGSDEVWLGTFHGFCVRLLRRYARLTGLPENFSIYDTSDAESALKTAVAESKFELTHVSLGALANRISYFKNRLITPEILESETLSSDEYEVGQVYPFYQRELLRNGAVDFDDLLMHTATLLRSYPEIRQDLDERMQYMLVDEYQDTNLAQYVIVRHLCVDHRNLTATGDPDQSIYGWRGANIKNVTNLERDYPDVRIIRLEENYRSTPEILSVADNLIQNNAFRKPKTLVPSRVSGNAVRLAIYSSGRNEAEDVAGQIESLVSQGEFQFRDFAVLYRTNAHSRQMEQALLRRQIPYQLIGGYRFYLRKEIKDLVSYLLLVNNPDDNVALRRAINTPPRGIGKKTIDRIESLASAHGHSMLDACRQAVASKVLTSKAAKSVAGFLTIFDQLVSLAHGPLLDLLQTAIELTRYREHLAKQRAGDDLSEVTANLDELMAEAHELDQETSDDRPALEAFLEFAALQADTDRLKTDHNIVTLMTLHAAKGLEFPCVYIMAVEENILPHSRSKDDPLSLEEERRLFFVGITRAKDHLQISYAKRRGFSGQGSGVPSSFLIELPRDEMLIVDQTENWGDGDYDADSQYAAQRRVAEWDEWNQLEQHEADYDDSSEFDEDCQLPPEEIRQRLGAAKSAKNSLVAKVMLASEMNQAHDERSALEVGSSVAHEKFGVGEIVAIKGRGPKRSVTIQFSTDGSLRTFRLSHASLKPIG